MRLELVPEASSYLLPFPGHMNGTSPNCPSSAKVHVWVELFYFFTQTNMVVVRHWSLLERWTRKLDQTWSPFLSPRAKMWPDKMAGCKVDIYHSFCLDFHTACNYQGCLSEEITVPLFTHWCPIESPETEMRPLRKTQNIFIPTGSPLMDC